MCVTALCSASSVTFAQASSASLGITVSDVSGAVIQSATATLRNGGTNQQQTLLSDKSGSASFPFLKPGHYVLTVAKTGFSDVTVDGIVLNVGDDKHLQLVLKVGAASQNVTVDGEALTINATDGSVNTVVDRKFVENLPLNGRSFQDLISLTPGVVTQSPQNSSQNIIGYSGDFSVNGQRTESNYYTVDGVSGNIGAGNGNGGPQAGMSGSLPASTALGTTQNLISVDALEEFRVQSSTYSAEYGRTPGGQFSLVTRSGTNGFHGSVFEYLRNNFFDANDWFNDHYDDPISPLRQNDFGGTLGGPLLIPRFYNGTNRTFYFVSYEGLRLTQPKAASVQYVPDSFMRNEAPSDLQPILNAFPMQNGYDYGSSSAPSLAEFIAPYSVPSEIKSASIRLDNALSTRVSLFLRWGYTPSSSNARILSSLTETRMNAQTYTAGITTAFTSRFNNQLRFGYAGARSAIASHVDDFGGATAVNLPAAMGAFPTQYAEPIFYAYIPGVGSSILETANAAEEGHQWNLVDTSDISLGHHQLRFGIDYRNIGSPTNPTSPTVEGVYESSQSILTNSATIAVLQKTLHSTPVFNEAAAFLQDEWRVSTHLSLSTGLRWEVDPPPTEAHGNEAYTLAGNIAEPSTLALAPKGTPLWRTTWYNFAPRIGMAWQAHRRPGAELVIRSGVGTFFDTDDQQAVKGFQGIGYFALSELFGASLPATPSQLDFSPSIQPPYTSTSVYAFPSHLQLPYTLEWNVSLEQALGEHQAFTIGYIGANGRRLIAMQELSIGKLNPDFNAIQYFKNGETSNYQALQASFQRSLTNSVQALASYTWSHSLDYGSNSSTIAVQRGNSDFDVRSNFQAALSWDLPNVTRQEVVKIVLNHWGIDTRLLMRTAFPITLQGNLATDAATGNQYETGVNLVAGVPIYLHGRQYPGGKALNPQAFALPAGNSAGAAPRNFARGFGEAQLNIAARRDFSIHDQVHLQFRAETFNLLNHPNFGYVDATLTDAEFGKATQMLNQSLGTVASQYQQGGSRSMQFALKLVF
jgi:hypothetical protein